MSLKASELETELLDAVCAGVRERLPEPQIAPCEAFLRQYYHWVPAEDLAERSPLDLLGAALAHWRLLHRRAPGEVKVRVYNPDAEHDGWQSPHTVMDVITDDMPFLVDSVTMELVRAGYGLDLVIHPVIRVHRDGEGRALEVVAPEERAPDVSRESILHAEISREPDGARRDELRRDVERVVREVDAAVSDWPAMRTRALDLVGELSDLPPSVDAAEVDQAQQFLRWLAGDRFTFLGFREYDLVVQAQEAGLRAVAGSGLGILRGSPTTPYKALGPKATALAQRPAPLVLTKANARATVHRPAQLDYIGVKRFDAEGRVIGERRFLGLYSTTAYRESPRAIPLLAGKVDQVLRRAGFPPDSHDAKALTEILETYPRDSLLQVGVDDLFATAMGILALGERQRVRLFARADALDRFADCLVCIPRDRFNTENRERVGRILVEAFGGAHVDWTPQLSESLLVRVQYIVHCPEGVRADLDLGKIEASMVKATRAWSDDLRDALVEERGRGSCRTRCSPVTGRRFRPPTGRARAPVCAGRHRQDRRAGWRAGADHQPLPATRCSSGRVPLQAVQPRGDLPFGRTSDVRAHGGQSRRRAALRGAARGPRSGLDLRLRPALSGGRPRAGARALRGCVSGRSPGRAGGRWAERAGAPRADERARGDDHPRDRQVPAPRGHRVLGCLHGADAGWPSVDSGPPGRPVRGCASIPTRPRARRGRAGCAEEFGDCHRRGNQPRRGSHPAQLSQRGHRNFAHKLFSGLRRARAAGVSRAQAGSASGFDSAMAASAL